MLLKRVVQTFVKETDTILYIKVAGEVIEATEQHVFYIDNVGWIPASMIEEGDKVVLQSGDKSTVEKIDKLVHNELIAVYNFEVEDFHTYFVSDASVLVHNNGGCTVDISSNMKSRVENSEVIKPNKRGNAPISKKDNRPIEIHHDEQNPNGPFFEMHPSNHRYGQNYKKNHPNYNKKSKINRKEFKKATRKYWSKEWDNGRWDNKNNE